MIPAAEAHRHQRHVVAGAFALVASLVLHFFVVEKLPAFSFGRPMDPEDVVYYPPVRLDQVIARPPDVAPMQADRFRPEDPGSIADAFGAPSVPEGVVAQDLPLPDAPTVKVGPMKGEGEPLAYLTPNQDATSWEPRQEVLQIEEKLLSDSVAALPRRIVPSVPRTPSVPDFTLPADLEAISRAGGGSADVLGDALSIARLEPQADALGSHRPSVAMLPPELALPDGIPGATESSREVSKLEATEGYLGLTLYTYQPQDEPGATYFEVHLARAVEEELPVLPKDVLLMQDSSESMTAWKLAECKAGLRRWLELLGPDDRFDIMGFQDAPYRCFDAWAPVNPMNIAKARKFIDDMRAQGNTDVYASLEAARRVERTPGRPVLAILVTDGRPTAGATDSSEIIESFSRQNEGEVAMFSFGAGRRVNRFLLDLLSFRNRGDSRVVVDIDRIPSNMERWAQETSRPVLIDLRYEFSGVNTDDVYPRTLTHMFLDRPLVLSGRVEGASERTAFQIVGQSGPVKRDMLFTLDWDTAYQGSDDLRQRWAWHKAYELIGLYTATRDPKLLKSLQAHATRYGLQVPYGHDLVAAP